MKFLSLQLITRVALLSAIIIVTQQFKFQYITGPLVNTTLIFAALTTGIPGAVFISILSPVLALIQGIMPNAALLPFIALGNLLYCIVFFGLRKKPFYGLVLAPPLKALVIASGAYFAIGLPLPGAYAVGLPQLITGFLGAMLFLLVWTYLPSVKNM